MADQTRRYTKKILELVDERVLDKDTLIRDLLNHMSEAEVQDFYETNHEEDCGSLDGEPEEDDDTPVDDDEDWRREQANEAGMLHGVDAYNDAMGQSTERPDSDDQ